MTNNEITAKIEELTGSAGTRRVYERVTPTTSTRIVVDDGAVRVTVIPTPARTLRALEGLCGLIADPGLWRGDILKSP